MENDKDLEIKKEEELGMDEKIKAGAKAVGRKIGDPDSDIGSEYDTEKTIERVEDWENIRWIDRWIVNCYKIIMFCNIEKSIKKLKID